MLLLFAGNMYILVHYNGSFGLSGVRNSYVGGMTKRIDNFDSYIFSWFELRYHLKDLDVVSDFKVRHKTTKESMPRLSENFYGSWCIEDSFLT